MQENTKYLNDLKTELDTYRHKLTDVQKHFKGATKKDIKNISAALEHLLEEAKYSYTQLKSASKEEWEPLKEISTRAFSDLKEAFEEFLDSSSDKARKLAAQAGRSSQEYAEHLGEYIKENPFKSILIAAGVGFVLGKVLK